MLEALGVTTYRVAVLPPPPPDEIVVIAPDEPATEPVVAVTTCDVPTVIDVVKLTAAMPFGSVAVVELANDPPFVLDHATV